MIVQRPRKNCSRLELALYDVFLIIIIIIDIRELYEEMKTRLRTRLAYKMISMSVLKSNDSLIQDSCLKCSISDRSRKSR